MLSPVLTLFQLDVGAGLTDVKNAGRCEGALCGISALVRRCGPWFEPYVLGLVPDMLLLLAHKVH
jgi:hypothetical protein